MDVMPTIEISPLVVTRRETSPPLDNGSEFDEAKSTPRVSTYSVEVKRMKSMLIAEVMKRPFLYDFNNPEYKNAELREQAWLHISNIMHENTEVLKREWKMLRDSLRQVMTRNRKLGGLPRRRWCFEKQMSFLIPYMSEKTRAAPNSSSSTFMTESSDAELQEDRNSQILEIADDLESEEQQQEEATQNPWAESQVTIQNPISYQNQPDDLELFFSSICQSAKRLPRTYQNNLKKQVLELLVKTEDEFERENPDFIIENC